MEILDERKRTALDALAEGKTIADAAKDAGVTRKTLYNWLTNDSRFVEAVNNLMTAVVYAKFQLAVPHLQSSVETMVEIMNDENNKPSVRLQAARDIQAIIDQGGVFASNSKIAQIQQTIKALNGGRDDA